MAAGPRDRSQDAEARLSIPPDAFIVTVQTYADTAGGAVTLLGSWDWRDDFVGQGDPMDVAAIQMTAPDCVELSEIDAAAAFYDEDLGPAPTLRSSGLAGDGVVWNVDARPIGFENQADHGVATVTADMQNCANGTARIGAAFTYEANTGGSVIGVGAGWGAFSVSYSGASDTLQKSTAPVYMDGLTILAPTGAFFASEAVCVENGHHGVTSGSFTKYRCVWEAAGDDRWELYTD